MKQLKSKIATDLGLCIIIYIFYFRIYNDRRICMNIYNALKFVKKAVQ